MILRFWDGCTRTNEIILLYEKNVDIDELLKSCGNWYSMIIMIIFMANVKGVIWFQKRGKLNPRYIGPFWILERVGPVAYHLELPPELSRIHNVFHVSMLKKYVPDPSHILETPPIDLEENLSFEVQPVAIVDQEMKQLRSKVIPMVKVLWRSDLVEEVTWETETFMRNHYPYLFEV